MNINHAMSVRSDFSLGESTFQVDKIIERAKTAGYASVALVDNMTVSNMVSFSDKAKKAGIKPIVGCTVRVYDNPNYRKPSKASGEKEVPNPFYTLKVYAKSETGIRSIMKLLSIGNSADYFYYHARVGLFEVLQLEDVVVSTGDFYSLFHHHDWQGQLAKLSDKFGDSLFLELVPIETPLFKTLNDRLIHAVTQDPAKRVVATYPTLYADADESESLDVLRAIATNAKMSSPWLPRQYVRDFDMKPPIDLARRVAKLYPTLAKASLQNIEVMASMCQYEFKKLEPCLPIMAANEFAAVIEQCKQGWHERLSQPILGFKPEDSQLQEYRDRLSYELGVLKQMGFSNYFLLVADIVKWAKGQDIIVGPGRGSVGGSLVAYLMGITDVDPIRFGLLFERFINPERIDLPDADLDFMSRRRAEVVDYIVQRYGQENVAGVSNYNALGAASALREVSRIHELDPFDYACSKQIEKEHGVSKSLEESVESVPEIEKFKLRFPKLWNHAINLEGALRGFGQHAAGIVVAGEPLINRAVVETRSGGPVVNWDKKCVEDWGLIKMDILGLSTLDMLDLGRQYVEERHNIKIDYLKMPLDDKRVLEEFGKGETTGVFQFESAGMRRLLKELRVAGDLTFDDLVAVVALFRPGPLDAGLCDDYVQIKQGAKRPFYEHANMEPALVPTFGVIVYQEQVMQIARDVAGFTMAGADHLRKAMGKKDRDMMALQRDKWVKGCMSHSGMTETDANILFDKIEVFAGYAFNKSHSVEYSIISYWTMWLKTNYPAEFYAASMTIADKEERIAALTVDARKKDIAVLPPDINLSSNRIEIHKGRELYAPFQAIKGISEKVAGSIMQVREWASQNAQAIATQPGQTPGLQVFRFGNKEAFYEALKASGVAGKVNKTHKENLEKVGAFAQCEGDPIDSMHADRLKDRLALLPGFTVDMVKASRRLSADKLAMISLIRIGEETRQCKDCSLAGRSHPLARIGKTPKFMMVFDAPNYNEERAGKLLEGDTASYVMAALKDAGISAQDGYFTTLVKSGKPKGAKTLTNEQINGCAKFIAREIETLKPPVIVAMGAATTKYFSPGLKGNSADLAGKAVFDSKLDAVVIHGFNPAQIVFDPSKVTLLQQVCSKIAELI